MPARERDRRGETHSMKILKPLLLVLSVITILFSTTMMIMTTPSSCTKTPTAAVAAEKEKINALVANINEKIPADKVVLKSDIDRIAKLIPYLIESAGYNKSQYTFEWEVCPYNHFHTKIVITSRYLNETEVFEIEGKYQYSDNNV